MNHFDPVLRHLLYSQFLTVRCELYQIRAKNPEVSSIKSFVGIQLQRNWRNACNLGLPAIQGCLTMCDFRVDKGVQKKAINIGRYWVKIVGHGR